MHNATLRTDQWAQILPLLRSWPDVYVGDEQECRRFLDAVVWMALSGAPWRLLPARNGKWNSVDRRFRRWSARGL